MTKQKVPMLKGSYFCLVTKQTCMWIMFLHQVNRRRQVKGYNACSQTIGFSKAVRVKQARKMMGRKVAQRISLMLLIGCLKTSFTIQQMIGRTNRHKLKAKMVLQQPYQVSVSQKFLGRKDPIMIANAQQGSP